MASGEPDPQPLAWLGIRSKRLELPVSSKTSREYIKSIASPLRGCYARLEVIPMAKVMVSFPNQFLKKVDRAALSQGRSRSGLIREALRAMLESPGRPSWKEAMAPLRELEEQWVGRWDSTDIIRYYRDRRYGRKNRR
jgi:Arc/MetJ-type ribon-helix-helix transcriptional regulator